jgi:hypothetical protein
MTVRIVTALSPAEAEHAIGVNLSPWFTHDYSEGAFVGRCCRNRIPIWHSKHRWNLPNMVFSGRIYPQDSGAIIEGRFEFPRHLKAFVIVLVTYWAFSSLRGIPSVQGVPALQAIVLLLLWALGSFVVFIVLRGAYRLLLAFSRSEQEHLKHQLVNWVSGAAA